MGGGTIDLLEGGTWECGSTEPGAVQDPGGLASAAIGWVAATVPGTVAGALRDAGLWDWGREDDALLDGRDWWFRTRVDAADDATGTLELDGLATLADVWLDGRHVLRSESMFVAHRVAVQGGGELVLRFAALEPVLRTRHKRPRWKSRLVRHQSLRWYRTTLLGRMPGWARWAAPVGPWRPVRLIADGGPPRLLEHRLRTHTAGHGGNVTIDATLSAPVERAVLRVGEHEAALAVDGTHVRGTVALEAVELWWPHTHGTPHRYEAALVLDDRTLALRPVAFRTIHADQEDGGFTLSVNDVPIFCRGACWGGPDAVTLNPSAEAVRASVRAARDTNLNMLRVGGFSCYEGEAFWEACDELGVLVWQDAMIASVDPPDDAAFWDLMRPELVQLLREIGDRPALAVLCGSSESHQQASMYGFGPERWQSALLEEQIPSVAAGLAPGIPYVPSSPTGGALPFSTDVGVTHYFGVGAYLRPLTDAKLSGVRFAAECLSFGNPPERSTIEEVYGAVTGVGHDPRWKLAVARDDGAPWDFEDVRNHYVREIFAADPFAVRYSDPEHALDLGRAVVCEITESVLSAWRRETSTCAGALVLCWQDLWPGAGWGFNDSLGRPKAPLHALRRACAPRTVRIDDDGLSGLRLTVFNDPAEPLRASVRVTVHRKDGRGTESAERVVDVGGHAALELAAEEILGGFRDLNRAYRFSPPSVEVVHVELLGEDGARIADAFFLPEGPSRPRSPDLGLTASLREDDGQWFVDLGCERFVQYVQLDFRGYLPADSWLHLAPGARESIALRPLADDAPPPDGTVRALNATSDVRVTR